MKLKDLQKNEENEQQLKLNEKLITAVKKRDSNQVQELIEAGADVNYQPIIEEKKGKKIYVASPLIIACSQSSSSLKIASLLLEKKADPNLRGSHTYNSPLIEAVRTGDLNLVSILVEHKADPNQINFLLKLVKKRLVIKCLLRRL